VKTLASASAAVLLSFVLTILTACGSSSHSSTTATGALSGNWQINLLQEFPNQTQPLRTLSVSGFLSQSGNDVTGSVQGPSILSSNGSVLNCGGTAILSGTVNGQSVTFTENIGGTLYTFTGAISLDNKSIAGDFQAPAGACFTTPTTGTFNAFQIPPLNGTFTGTLQSQYMGLLQTGGLSANPVSVSASGSFTQSDNAGGSSASVSGTVTAVGYPCFSTVSMTGTISGQSVYLDVYNYNGDFIGTLGTPPGTGGASGEPATVVADSTGFSLVSNNPTGLDVLFLGIDASGSVVGPCPAVILGNSGASQTSDSAPVNFNFQ
jgi:hypothetical protein